MLPHRIQVAGGGHHGIVTPVDPQRIRDSFATDGPAVPAPSGLSLMPFQRGGVAFALRALAESRACIIADDMGLGKTIQGLAVANRLGIARFLVVCPAGLRINWQREAAKWLWWADAKIVGYEEAVRHPERTAGDWPLVIYDEAHYMKTPGSKRTQRGLAVTAQRKLFLSGTPIQNRPVELWPILNAIDPGAWGSLNDYGVRYCAGKQVWKDVKFKRGAETIRKKVAEWDFSGASNLVELQQRLRSTIMVRRMKAQVLKDLPAKVRQLIEFPAHAAGASPKLLAAVAKLWANQKSAHSPEAVARLSDERRLLLEQIAKVRHEEALAKVRPSTQHIRDMLASVDKVIVFAHHRDVMDAIMADLSLDFKCVTLRGGMSDKAKQAAVDEFQNGDARAIIGQIQAAGVGWTLTAASTVIFVELDWVPGQMSQCEDRAHRIGQLDSVLVQHLVIDGTLDARISHALMRKQRVIDQALNDAPASAEPLDEVEALALGEGSLP